MIKLAPIRKERENVIPLINVVFLLLIFFMIAGQMAQPEALAVTPPDSSSAHDIAGMDKKLLVDRNGTIMHGDETLLKEQLASAFAGKLHGPLMVKIDKNCVRDCFLPVLAALESAGLKKIRLVTLQGPATF